MTRNLPAGVPVPQPARSAPAATPPGTMPATNAPPAADSQAKPQFTSRPGKPPAGKPPAGNVPAGKPPAGKPPAGEKRRSWQRPPAPAGDARGPAPGAGRAVGVAADTRTTAERRVRIGSPAALLAVVPVLLGFEPGNSVVVIGTDGPGAQVRLTLRYDLPDPRLAAAVAGHAMSVLSAQRVQTAVAVGYGPGHLVSPVAAALRELAPLSGVTVTELLRAEGQRYWSYLCAEPACCPPEGTPFDVRDHPAARAMAAAGGRVLASRDDLAATVAPATGDAAGRMRQATGEAEERISRAVGRAARSGRKASVRRLIATAGLPAVSEAISRYRGGGHLEPERAAWLTVVLRDLRVRDDAWSRMRPEHREAHQRLWTDLTRLAQPGYVAAPAALLAFVAWQSGNGALANVALDRAQADDPHYSMAALLRQVIDSGAPPSLARLPMTPEEVATSYDALDEDAARDRGEADGGAGEAGGDESGGARDG